MHTPMKCRTRTGRSGLNGLEPGLSGSTNHLLLGVDKSRTGYALRMRHESSDEFGQPTAYTNNSSANQETLMRPMPAGCAADGWSSEAIAPRAMDRAGWSIDLPFIAARGSKSPLY